LDTALIVAVALLVILGIAAVIIARQQVLSWRVPALRSAGKRAAAASSTSGIDLRARPGETETGADHEWGQPRAMAARAGTANGPASVSDETAATSALPSESHIIEDVALSARFERIENQLEAVSRSLQEALTELHRFAQERAARSAEDEAKHEAALVQMRTDLLAAIAERAYRQPVQVERQAQVCSDLYARLARFEAALAAVVNPVLLPGEAFAPPDELMPEALIWENWNEVGERAFALADAFSGQRLYLSEETRRELGEFVTSTRQLLTRTIYPNLQPEPSRQQQIALRTALESLAAEIARMRTTIEREFRGV
jgi:hypothetical protein